MWKDFFYYSKQQRVVTILIIMIMLFSIIIMIFLFTEKQPQNEYILSNTIDSFLLQVKEKKEKYYKNKYHKSPIIPISYFKFDPNTIDSLSMIKLGLPYYVAHNIIRYREAKGVFRNKEQFKKIYGLKADLYNKLESYIDIPQMLNSKTDIKIDTLSYVRDSSYNKYPKGTLVDLNSADTTILKKIPGIASGIAKMIVYYRNKIGGFYSIDQLNEINYIDDNLKEWFEIKTCDINKIKINELSLDRLRSHPYINFYQAKAIIEYRRKKGKIKNLSQLSMFDEFTEKDLNRLSYYLSFD